MWLCLVCNPLQKFGLRIISNAGNRGNDPPGSVRFKEFSGFRERGARRPDVVDQNHAGAFRHPPWAAPGQSRAPQALLASQGRLPCRGWGSQPADALETQLRTEPSCHRIRVIDAASPPAKSGRRNRGDQHVGRAIRELAVQHVRKFLPKRLRHVMPRTPLDTLDQTIQRRRISPKSYEAIEEWSLQASPTHATSGGLLAGIRRQVELQRPPTTPAPGIPATQRERLPHGPFRIRAGSAQDHPLEACKFPAKAVQPGAHRWTQHDNAARTRRTALPFFRKIAEIQAEAILRSTN